MVDKIVIIWTFQDIHENMQHMIDTGTMGEIWGEYTRERYA